MIDSLNVSFFNEQSAAELAPPSTDDPVSRNISIGAFISFYISNPELVKDVTVQLGKESTKGDYRSLKFSCVKEGGKYFLTMGNSFYELINNKVYIKQNIPVISLNTPT